MGGSTLGALRNAMSGDTAIAAIEYPRQPEPAMAMAKTSGPEVKVANETVQPRFRDGLERACYFPGASGRGLPCT
mgnify:CR=1 FL=1